MSEPGQAPIPSDMGIDARAATGRPLAISIAAGVLIVTGTFICVVGLVFLVVAVVNLDPGSLPDYVGATPQGFVAMAVALGVLAAVYGAIQVVAGVQATRGRRWARSAGIAQSIAGAAVMGYAIVAPGRSPDTAAPLIFVPVIVAMAYAATALAVEARWFEGD